MHFRHNLLKFTKKCVVFWIFDDGNLEISGLSQGPLSYTVQQKALVYMYVTEKNFHRVILTHFFHNIGIIATLFHWQEPTFGQTRAQLAAACKILKECTPRARGYANDDIN